MPLHYDGYVELAAGKTVHQLRRRGVSLRGIAEETSLGLQTVRTILDQQDGVDRTTIKQLQRIDPDRARERVWQAKRQMRQSLPRRNRRGGEGQRRTAQGSQETEIKDHVTA